MMEEKSIYKAVAAALTRFLLNAISGSLNRRHAMRDVAGIKPAARVDGKLIYVSLGWGHLFPAQKKAFSRNGFKKT